MLVYPVYWHHTAALTQLPSPGIFQNMMSSRAAAANEHNNPVWMCMCLFVRPIPLIRWRTYSTGSLSDMIFKFTLVLHHKVTTKARALCRKSNKSHLGKCLHPSKPGLAPQAGIPIPSPPMSPAALQRKLYPLVFAIFSFWPWPTALDHKVSDQPRLDQCTLHITDTAALICL